MNTTRLENALDRMQRAKKTLATAQSEVADAIREVCVLLDECEVEAAAEAKPSAVYIGADVTAIVDAAGRVH